LPLGGNDDWVSRQAASGGVTFAELKSKFLGRYPRYCAARRVRSPLAATRSGAVALLGSIFVFICGGCQPLAPGPIEAVGSAPQSIRAGDVYLIRGWRDLYSTGIDRLSAELQDLGIRAQAYRESQWEELASAIVRSHRILNSHGPLVLIGFSYGADDVLRISEKCQSVGISAELVITIDPVTPPPVPGNVRACYNYFQTNGVWDVFPWLRGIPLTSSGTGMLVNVDIRRQRPDLLEKETAHSNIAANPKLHREIIQRVLAVCPLRDQVK
jgi:hypothetical protein